MECPEKPIILKKVTKRCILKMKKLFRNRSDIAESSKYIFSSIYQMKNGSVGIFAFQINVWHRLST